jgi:hypothetical protein
MDLLPQDISAIDALIEKRQRLFLLRSHEIVDSAVDAVNRIAR